MSKLSHAILSRVDDDGTLLFLSQPDAFRAARAAGVSYFDVVNRCTLLGIRVW